MKSRRTVNRVPLMALAVLALVGWLSIGSDLLKERERALLRNSAEWEGSSVPTVGIERIPVSSAPASQSDSERKPRAGELYSRVADSAGTLLRRQAVAMTYVASLHGGVCATAAAERIRRAYLAGFEPREAVGLFGPAAALDDQRRGLVLAAPDVEQKAINEVFHSLSPVRDTVSYELGLDVPPPQIYVHASVEDLRGKACGHSLAVAYYDGSIHLSVPSRREADQAMASDPLPRTLLSDLLHEYVHHAMVSRTVDAPLWFHEGTAMAVAGDPWSGWRPSGAPLPLEVMLQPLGNADANRAEAIYGQAYQMMAFLRQTCANACALSDMVAALREGHSTSAGLFDWAVREFSADHAGTSAALWGRYWNEGFQFVPPLPWTPSAAGDVH